MHSARFGTILCPVDFSELSAHALREAARFAVCDGSKLVVLYANSFEAPPYFTESRVEELRNEFRDSVSEAERSLAAFVKATLGEGSPAVEISVVEGLPADVILKSAADLAAGMIVMGTHGRTGFNLWTMGSVAERVLRESAVPLITVRGPAELPAKILCPVTDTEASRNALRVAAELAACFGASLTALHVPDADADPPDICSWIPAETRARCRLSQVVRHGDPSTQIIDLAARERFDLLVLGAPRRRFFDGFILGATALRAARHAPCPVLTVPDPALKGDHD